MSLRLEPSVAVREGRLTRLLAERGLSAGDAGLARIVEDAELVGSLELASLSISWDDARAANPPPPLQALRRARAAVSAGDRFTLAAVRAWHEALAGPVGFRQREAAGARPEFIEERLASLAEWLEAKGVATLAPEQKSAVALARIVEIRPFDEANGRVARLAAAHVLRRAGQKPPILVGGDGPRLQAALEAAHRLETGPLVELVREASGRALDVMIQSLERGLV
jgi:hypothetical protein